MRLFCCSIRTTSMRAVLLINPNSGQSVRQANGEPVEAYELTICAALQARGVEAEVWHTQEDSCMPLVQRAIDQGIELVIAAGGDGTMHSIASCLISSTCT